jgi:hypothetical protein
MRDDAIANWAWKKQQGDLAADLLRPRDHLVD